MSTKKVTDTSQTTQFNPAGMAAYNQMTPQMAQVMQMYMSNPLTASYFTNQLGMANKSIGQSGQSNMLTLLNNARQFGGGGGGSNPYLMSQMALGGRAQSANQSNAFTNLLMGAEGNRRWAAGSSAGYSPLQTGMTRKSTEQTSGLGTWLPQLLGGAIGAATNLIPGMGAVKGALATVGGALPTSTQGSQNPFMNFSGVTPTNPGGNSLTSPYGISGSGGLFGMQMGSN